MAGSLPMHAHFIASPAGGLGGMLTGCRSRPRKIGEKCQFAKDICNFCEKGEFGALAMIYLVRLSRLGSPDVL